MRPPIDDVMIESHLDASLVHFLYIG